MPVRSSSARPPRALIVATAAMALLGVTPLMARAAPFEIRSLDGGGNNLAHPSWGQVGDVYQRLAPARYADGVGALAPGPPPRFVSNRVFNSLGVNLFSERNLSQWAWVWGQFLDHTFGMAQPGSESAPIPFNSSDPLEQYTATAGSIPFTRNAYAQGTGTSRANPRQQVNTVNSFIDGWAVYGGDPQRLAWLRAGPGDGSTSGASLLLPGDYLPVADARHDYKTAPVMQLEGALTGNPQAAIVAGDIRANENAELTAVHTLFAREHNRIVARLPRALSPELRFQIARRIVGAEEQYITYDEFLPALGVRLARYTGYDPRVDPELTDEFATVGYRLHSMVNGQEHIVVPAGVYSSARRSVLRSLGVVITAVPGSRRRIELTIPQNAAFYDPALVPAVGLGPLLSGLADEPSYRNDEQIDDSLRSVLFEFPAPGSSDPAACQLDPTRPGCEQGVVDLPATDIQRERDDGMPTYNRLRIALGLAPQRSFTQVTGERTERFPAGLRSRHPIDDPAILSFTSLRDLAGRRVAAGSSSARAVYATRRTTLAARLKAIYGSVDRLDAFVGMVSEPHVPGAELGQLQLALFRRQFTALRDGDRFFYLNDPALAWIWRRFRISYRHTLGQLIALDAGVSARALPRDVFFAPAPARATPLPAPAGRH